jgi:hypothetical protein
MKISTTLYTKHSAFSPTTLNIMTLSIKGLFKKLDINENQHNNLY